MNMSLDLRIIFCVYKIHVYVFEKTMIVMVENGGFFSFLFS